MSSMRMNVSRVGQSRSTWAYSSWSVASRSLRAVSGVVFSSVIGPPRANEPEFTSSVSEPARNGLLAAVRSLRGLLRLQPHRGVNGRFSLLKLHAAESHEHIHQS